VGTDIRDAMGRPSRVTFHNDMRWLLDQGLIVRSEVGVYRLKIHGPQLVVGGEGS
jgi:hypothetical protein